MKIQKHTSGKIATRNRLTVLVRFVDNIDRVFAIICLVIALVAYKFEAYVRVNDQIKDILEYASAVALSLVILISAFSWFTRRFLGQNPFETLRLTFDRKYFSRRMHYDWTQVLKYNQIPFWSGILKPVSSAKRLKVFNDLNAEAFTATSSMFGYGVDLIHKRNLSLFNKEKDIFAFVRDRKKKLLDFHL